VKAMSFASKTKEELCALRDYTDPCCKLSLAYAMLLFSGEFTVKRVRLASENKAVILLAQKLFKELFFANPTTQKGQLLITNPEELARIFAIIGHNPRSQALRLDRGLLSPCCTGFFLRGAFLVAGTVTNPEKDYHFEITTSHHDLSLDLIGLLRDAGFAPKRSVRKSNYVVYLKESEQIEDILNMIGAHKAAFTAMDAKIEKELRNTANRITNCETANIGKTVGAAVRQIEAIKLLKKHKKFSQLPAQLQEVAQLRLKYPEMTLQQLGSKLDPPIGKSGVNHRLARIMELAQEIEMGEEQVR